MLLYNTILILVRFVFSYCCFQILEEIKLLSKRKQLIKPPAINKLYINISNLSLLLGTSLIFGIIIMYPVAIVSLFPLIKVYKYINGSAYFAKKVVWFIMIKKIQIFMQKIWIKFKKILLPFLTFQNPSNYIIRYNPI